MPSCPQCGRKSPPDRDTGYDGYDEFCSAECEEKYAEGMERLATEQRRAHMAKESLAVVVSEKKSLIADLADQYGLEPGKFMETLKATILPSNATNEQAAAFLVVAKQYDLNPFVREIFAFPGKGGGIVPVISVDGWITLLNRQPALDGVEFQDHVTGNELVSITCRIYRKDRSRPIEVTEYMDECQRSTEPWQKWPARMLRHKAMIQCARYAFGLAGVYDEDEAERISEVPERVRLIGTSDQSKSTEAAVEISEEEKAQREKIHALCQELDHNGAQEKMLLGQFQGKLDSLIEVLGHEKAEKAKTQATDTPTAQAAEDKPSNGKTKGNGKKFNF